MNRTDRLFAIVLDLRARGRQRAEDIAARYETSVRTIYRDMEALAEAGVPIVALPGAGYELDREYFLPPLHLRVEEATVLAVGADYAAATFDTTFRDAARRARDKILAAVPAPVREGIAPFRDAVRLIGAEPAPDVAARLAILREAVVAQRRVRFAYRGRADDAPRERRVAPYACAHVMGAWYVVGHDAERDAIRRFMVSRMDAIVVEDTRFERDPEFRLEPQDDEPRVQATIRFAARIAPFVRERIRFFDPDCREEPDGTLVAKLFVRPAFDLAAWVLPYGAEAEVLAPPELRDAVIAAARAVLATYADTAAT